MTVGNEGGFSSADHPHIALVDRPMNQTNHRNQLHLSAALIAATMIMLLGSGCSTVTGLVSKPLPVEDANLAAARGTYSVEMHSNFGQPRQYKGALTGTTTVTDALAKAGAVKKFRDLDVEILRIVEHKGHNRGLRMPIEFDSATGTPSPEQDYALLDGDRIVVKPKQSSGLVKMVGAMMSR